MFTNRAHRPVRSYVIREGRLTPGQERALEDHWSAFGVDLQSVEMPIDFSRLFGNRGPVVMEIGFGDGGALREMAQSHPEWNLLGVEVHRPGIGNLLLRLARDGICNVRVVRGDAVELLVQAIAPDSLHRIHLYFPDPWPKKRHHKRRILSAEFADLIASRLVPGSGLRRACT
jgi:tRNA (guanine-N7-)-methyltransferase